jgi:parallel beta-helix repeat protein
LEAEKAEMENEKRVKIRKRERLVITVLFTILALNVCVGCASAATYTVCPSGCNYISIQAAINAADPGDTIEVHSGTYYEHVNVNKQLILKGVGTGSGKPVVDSGGNDSVITLSANGITFEGFTVTNSGNLYGGVGIKVTSNNNTITGNTASNNGYSICLNDSCNNTISGNNASNNDYGIYLNDSCNNSITGNNASNNGYGIYLNDSCNNNTISGNIVSNNVGGIYLNDSCNNSITGNNASNNGYGIYLRYSCNNTITGNNASNNKDGISLRDSSNNIISNNTFVNDGLFVERSYQNTVEDNIVNGKPLVYLEEASGIGVTDAGQVILVNCTNIMVENLDLSTTSVCVELWETEGSIVSNNTVSNSFHGIYLSSSSNNTITGNNASNNNGDGIYLSSSSNNTITENNAGNNGDGICISSSSNNNRIIDNNASGSNHGAGIRFRRSNNNTIIGNTASNNWDGIYISSSSNNTITGNSVSNNFDGINFRDSSNNTITGNNVSNNALGIVLSSSSNNNTITGNVFVNDGLFGGYQNMVKDNTVNGKPLVYLEDASDYTVEDAGQVILVNCTNITVENLDLSRTSMGIILLNTKDSKILNNTASNSYCGCGIYLSSSCNNTLKRNNVSSNLVGICLTHSSNNTITGNNASNNEGGIAWEESNNNNIYLNNFINNTLSVSSSTSNIWNSTDEITYTYNGSTYTNYLGNYWSDYKEKYPEAEEINGYGIWDMQYSIGADRDKYPLIQPCENYLAPAASVFDTGAGTYPSIMGTHTGTIKPSSNINVSKLYTYSCAGTGGHTKSIELEENGTVIANGTWDGYHEDWHNITLHNVTDGTHYVTLLQDHEYN